MSRYRWRFLGALGIVAIATGCVFMARDVFHPPTPTATEVATWPAGYYSAPEFSPADFETALTRNQTLWESKHIAHYTISVDLSGMSYEGTPWTVEVDANNVVSITDANGTTMSPSEFANYDDVSKQFLTVPALFSFVEQTYQDQPSILRVEYDSNFGYPKDIYVDPWSEPCCQDYWITVGDLHILP